MGSALSFDLRLLADLPSASVGEDVARTSRLASQIATQFRATPAPVDGVEPVCLGLFGGLGQGKTTVIKQAIHEASLSRIDPQKTLSGLAHDSFFGFDARCFRITAADGRLNSVPYLTGFSRYPASNKNLNKTRTRVTRPAIVFGARPAMVERRNVKCDGAIATN